LAELQTQIAADKTQHLEEMRRAAHLQNEAVAVKAQVDNLRRERDRLRQRSDLAATSLASLDIELQELQQAESQQLERLHQARQAMLESKQEHERFRQLRDRTGERISELRQERSGLASRIEVLEGLIRSREGLGAGVRDVIEQIEKPDAGPWATVIGMIADFLTVKHEYAPLIDLALGDWAQRFIVRDMGMLTQVLAERTTPLSGRVSFLPLLSIPHEKEANENPILQALRQNRLVQVSLMSRAWSRSPSIWCHANIRSLPICRPSFWVAR
jgi:chromosome segregation protein